MSPLAGLLSTIVLLTSFSHACPPTDSYSGPKPPQEIRMKWQNNDEFLGGWYVMNVSIGCPPQILQLVQDSETGDILIHQEDDPVYLKRCAEQTPVEICVLFNETESATLVDLGNGTYRDMDSDPSTGDYVTDVVMVGGVSVKNQTVALLNHSSFPVSFFGMGFTADAGGVKSGTFHEYKTFMESLKDEGVYDAAAYSTYLDPSLGPNDNPNTFPDGQLVIGGIDTGLMDGPFTTLPIVDDNSTEVSTHPKHFNLLLSSMHLGNSRHNLVSNSAGESCVISTGANALYVINETYTNIVNSFPHAAFNESTTLFEVPCSDRFDSDFEMSFEFIDPRSRTDPTADTSKIQFRIPASEMVWPADRLFPGGDPNTCAIAAYSIIDLKSGESIGVPCSLGVNMMKTGYWVFDMTNLQVSFAPAAKAGSKSSNLVRLPEGGVSALFK